MKKIILSFTLILCVAVAASAQDVERPKGTSTKSGQYILPAAGDFAIGIEATPYLQYIGNIFNGTSGNNANNLFNGVDNTIYGKYFLTDNSAIRAKLMFNFGKETYEYASRNDTEFARNPLNSEASVVDYDNYSNSDIALSVGYELRRGYGRLQGFYGGEVMLGYGSSKRTYEYGNEMTSLNQTPTTFGSTVGARSTEVLYGSTITAGLGGFVGVEYFFAPKISIGGELGLGLRFSNQGLGENTYESFDVPSNSVQTITTRRGNSADDDTRFSTQTEGKIFLMFHF